MSKLKDILSGWKNYYVPDPLVEEEAKRRAKICGQCPSAKKGYILAVMSDENMHEIEGMYCGECECPLSAAVRSKSKKCDLNKW